MRVVGIGVVTAVVRRTVLGAWRLVCGLKNGTSRPQDGEPDELARYDDVLDAWLDDDGMDATGL
jgi:hypothetical protein